MNVINDYSPSAMWSSFCGYATKQYNNVHAAVESRLSKLFTCCYPEDKSNKPLERYKPSEATSPTSWCASLSALSEKISKCCTWNKQEENDLEVIVLHEKSDSTEEPSCYQNVSQKISSFFQKISKSCSWNTPAPILNSEF